MERGERKKLCAVQERRLTEPAIELIGNREIANGRKCYPGWSVELFWTFSFTSKTSQKLAVVRSEYLTKTSLEGHFFFNFKNNNAITFTCIL